MEHLPWQPIRPGYNLKLLRGGESEADPRVLLLKLAPGTTIARHRHLGDVHAVNLAGHRQLDTGELIGPQQYVYEPVGNVDSWAAVGDGELIVFVITRGAMEYLDADGNVTSSFTTPSMTASYRAYCASVQR